MDSIGVLEFKRIPKGVLALDKIIKGSSVEIIIGKMICPGKFLIVFSGGISDIKYSVSLIEEYFMSSDFICEIISNVSKEVLNKVNSIMKFEKTPRALAIVESRHTAQIFKIADFLYKEFYVEVKSLKINVGVGGRGVLFLTGDLSSMEKIETTLENEQWKKLIMSFEVIQSPIAETLIQLK